MMLCNHCAHYTPLGISLCNRSARDTPAGYHVYFLLCQHSARGFGYVIIVDAAWCLCFKLRLNLNTGHLISHSYV